MGARVIGGLRDLRSPQAGRRLPSLPCPVLVCRAREAQFKFRLCCFMLGRVSVTSQAPLPVRKGGGLVPAHTCASRPLTLHAAPGHTLQG